MNTKNSYIPMWDAIRNNNQKSAVPVMAEVKMNPTDPVAPILPNTDGVFPTPEVTPDTLPEVAPSPPTTDGVFPTPEVTPSPSFPSLVPPINQIIPIPTICTGCPNINDNRYCKVRFLHTVPGVGPVRVEIGNTIVANELDYAEYTNYIGVASSFWNVSVYSERTNELLVKQAMMFEPGISMTLAVVLSGEKADLLAIYQTSCVRYDTGLACIRFSNLSQQIGTVDIFTDNYNLVASDLGYKSVTTFRPAREDNYKFIVLQSKNTSFSRGDALSIDGRRIDKDSNSLLTDINPVLEFSVNILSGKDYTVCIIGDSALLTPIQVVVLED